MSNISVTKAFDYIVLNVKFGLISCKELATALMYKTVNPVTFEYVSVFINVSMVTHSLLQPWCIRLLIQHHLSMFGFLNQARAGLWLAHAWFLKIDPVRIIGMRVRVCMCVCVCVCPRPKLLITSGVI